MRAVIRFSQQNFKLGSCYAVAVFMLCMYNYQLIPCYTEFILVLQEFSTNLPNVVKRKRNRQSKQSKGREVGT